MNYRIKGLIIKATETAESSVLLKVLTEYLGVIYVTAKGAIKPTASFIKSTQPLSYSEMDLYKKGDYYTLTEATLIESFYDLRNDMEAFAIGCYAADICTTIAIADDNEPLRLLLNTLYALTRKIAQKELIKAAFELRAACISGVYPYLNECFACGSTIEPDKLIVDISEGGAICGNCYKEYGNEKNNCFEMNAAVYGALAYIRDTDSKKLFSFEIKGAAAQTLCRFAESYILYCLEKNFPSLAFYKKITDTKTDK